MSLGQFLPAVDRADVFLPSQSVLELFGRASAIYFILFVRLRLVLPCLERLVREPKPELIASEELTARRREQGLDDCSQVRAAYVEADGTISVLRRENRG